MKKMFYGLGALTAVVAPVAIASDCGGKKVVSQQSNPTQAPTSQQGQVEQTQPLFEINGNTFDLTKTDISFYRRLYREYPSLAFINYNLWPQADKLKYDAIERESYKECSIKLLEFANARVGQEVVVTDVFGPATMTISNNYNDASNFLNDLYDLKQTIDKNLIKVIGNVIELTQWRDALVKLMHQLMGVNSFDHLTLDQYIIFFNVKERFFYDATTIFSQVLADPANTWISLACDKNGITNNGQANFWEYYDSLSQVTGLNLPVPTV